MGIVSRNEEKIRLTLIKNEIVREKELFYKMDVSAFFGGGVYKRLKLKQMSKRIAYYDYAIKTLA